MKACCHQVYLGLEVHFLQKADVTDYVEFERCGYSPGMDGLVLWEIWEL